VSLHRQDLARSHNNLGYLLANLARELEAEDLSHSNLGLLLAGLRKCPAAEEQYSKALAIKEKLAAEFPTVPQYRVDMGGTYCIFGDLFRNSGEPGKSLEWYEKAIRTLTVVYNQDPQLVPAKQFLRQSHWNRAIAYHHLRRFTEAIKDWDKAIELSPIAEQSRPRAARATTRLETGQVAEAVAEVVELTKNAFGDAMCWYNFACFYAIASGKSTEKKQPYADRAIDLLHKAVKAGWSDAAYAAQDTFLDPIRGREDFKKLIEDLAKKSPAKPEQK
jgi:tetratricopeptide (TPR) repeat protein